MTIRFDAVLKRGVVHWTDASAAKYASFILLHEVGHLVYSKRHGDANVATRVRRSGAEEKFCNEWAATMLARMAGPMR